MRAFDKKEFEKNIAQAQKKSDIKKFIGCLLAAIMLVAALFMLFGCKVKTKSTQKMSMQKTEHVTADIVRDSVQVTSMQEEQVKSSTTMSSIWSWLNRSVDMELTTKHYALDSSGGSYLAYEQNMKRKEESKSGSKSDIAIYTMDSLIKSKIDSSVLAERERWKADMSELTKTAEKTNRTAGASWPIFAIVAVVLCTVVLVMLRFNKSAFGLW